VNKKNKKDEEKKGGYTNPAHKPYYALSGLYGASVMYNSRQLSKKADKATGELRDARKKYKLGRREARADINKIKSNIAVDRNRASYTGNSFLDSMVSAHRKHRPSNNVDKGLVTRSGAKVGNSKRGLKLSEAKRVYKDFKSTSGYAKYKSGDNPMLLDRKHRKRRAGITSKYLKGNVDNLKDSSKYFRSEHKRASKLIRSSKKASKVGGVIGAGILGYSAYKISRPSHKRKNK
jgi:hypothetical protein